MWNVTLQCPVYYIYNVLYESLASYDWRYYSKQVYAELDKQNYMGFTTWGNRLNELIINHGMDITKLP